MTSWIVYSPRWISNKSKRSLLVISMIPQPKPRLTSIRRAEPHLETGMIRKRWTIPLTATLIRNKEVLLAAHLWGT